MDTTCLPLRALLLTVSGWVHREQQRAIDYLREEIHVLKEQLGTKRLRLTDDQRRRLFCQLASIVPPGTIHALATVTAHDEPRVYIPRA